MNNLEFVGFPKMARLTREVVVTEKIDGTNAQILITEHGDIFTGSRRRWITPDDDNFGFAAWVAGNKEEILKLGAGRHFGEWWGHGIQRGYGLPRGERRLSLFDTIRWVEYGNEPQRISGDNPKVNVFQKVLPEIIGLVPVLYRGVFDTVKIDEVLNDLKMSGSRAMSGFPLPEGIVIYHIQGKVGFKKTIENDDTPKSKIIKK